MAQNEGQQIDRYLDNSLTGSELKEFIDRLDTDPAFRERVSFHNLLIEGIQEAEDKRLCESLKQRINYQKPAVPFALKLIFTFLLITAAGIALWNYTGPDSSGNKYFSFNIFRDKNVNKEMPEKDIVKKDVPNKKPPAKIEKETVNIMPVDTQAKQVEDIVVKKDQLLISYPLIATDVDEKKEGESDPASAEEKDQEKGKSEKYDVEFWVSPVNYRGYKLLDGKLILFGIEEPDAVQLFTEKNNLWMKYGNEFFSLQRSDNFEAFVSASEIPSALR